MFKAAPFTVAKTWKCPLIDEWIGTVWCIYAMEYYSAIEKKEIIQFVTPSRDLEFII